MRQNSQRRDPSKVTRTRLDTIIVSKKEAAAWRLPPFQRPLKVNSKVTDLASEIGESDVIPGVITLGTLANGKDRTTYLLDGQHRRHAFLLSKSQEAFVDVRIHDFDSMADMGQEFVDLNSRLVTMRPDDVLRGLEESVESIAQVKKRCGFVGYDCVRRGSSGPIVSMSTLFRAWDSASGETPASHPKSALSLVQAMEPHEVEHMIRFANMAHGSWGGDREHWRLWGALNLTLCMWIYRMVVLGAWQTNKSHRITQEQFMQAMMSLAADAGYTDWLLGRALSERDRSPAYGRIKAIMVARLSLESGKRVTLPNPIWDHNSGNRK